MCRNSASLKMRREQDPSVTCTRNRWFRTIRNFDLEEVFIEMKASRDRKTFIVTCESINLNT